MSASAFDRSIFDRMRYDARPVLSDAERADLVRIDACRLFRQTTERERLAWRLYVPVRDALVHGRASKIERTIAWGAFTEYMLRLDRPYFGWSADDWEAFVGPGGPCERRKLSRACALSVGYLCCDFRGFTTFDLATAYTTPIAERVFGSAAVVAADERVGAFLEAAGYPRGKPVYLRRAVSLLLLAAGSPEIGDVHDRARRRGLRRRESLRGRSPRRLPGLSRARARRDHAPRGPHSGPLAAGREDGRRAGVGRVVRPLAGHLAAPCEDPRQPPQHPHARRAVAGRAPPRGPLPRRLDGRDVPRLRGVRL